MEVISKTSVVRTCWVMIWIKEQLETDSGKLLLALELKHHFNKIITSWISQWTVLIIFKHQEICIHLSNQMVWFSIHSNSQVCLWRILLLHKLVQANLSWEVNLLGTTKESWTMVINNITISSLPNQQHRCHQVEEVTISKLLLDKLLPHLRILKLPSLLTLNKHNLLHRVPSNSTKLFMRTMFRLGLRHQIGKILHRC